MNRTIHTLFFSPTHSSREIARTLADGLAVSLGGEQKIRDLKTLAGEILCRLFLPRSPLGKNKETCKKWPKARRCGKKAHRGPFAPVVPGGISCYNTGKHLT